MITREEAVKKIAKEGYDESYQELEEGGFDWVFDCDGVEVEMTRADLNWEHEIKGSNHCLLGTDLITKINEWADERNLKQADPKIQWMRITEEVGEIRDVLLKPTKFTDPQMALKDAVGDTLVTIIVLAHQLDLDVTECLSIAYEEIKNRKGKMVNGTFVKEEDL